MKQLFHYQTINSMFPLQESLIIQHFHQFTTIAAETDHSKHKVEQLCDASEEVKVKGYNMVENNPSQTAEWKKIPAQMKGKLAVTLSDCAERNI